MSLIDRISSVVTDHSLAVVLALLVVTAGLGLGVTDVKSSSGLDQFETDSPEAEAQDYLNDNFSSRDGNTTTVQVIVRNESGNVLSRASLLRSLRFQQRLRDDPEVGTTLTEDDSTIGVENVVAITAIRTEQAEELQEDAEALEERNETLQERREELERRGEELERRGEELNRTAEDLNRTAENLAGSLNRTRELQIRYERLNASLQLGEIDRATYRERSNDIEDEFGAVRTDATANLTEAQARNFTRAMDQVRSLTHQLALLNASLQRGRIDRETYRERAGEIQDEIAEAYELGTRGVLAGEYRQLEEDAEQLEEDAEQLEKDSEQLEADFEALQDDAEALQDRREELENAPRPTLEEQIDKLESMNASEVEDVVETVMDDGSNGDEDRNGNFVYELMSENYESGETEATGRVILLRQSTEENLGASGEAPERIETSQLATQDVASDHTADDEEYLVFGAGIISHEIQASQNDSLLLISPLAILFVLLTLLIAYRDLLDIVLGLGGIAAVMVWTFGFMGHAEIAFNQVMVAVPVLLIGLSIDYAIHIFMRHREQRYQVEDGPRGSMKVALGGVGVALLWVTATTVIGFLSNLTSPVGPIQDFGVVSAVGIVAALFVFGALIPALKVMLDERLESWGLDRKKRAFGTGGGQLGSVLSVGATAARRSAPTVIVAALLLSAVGGAFGSQVSTEFQQEDFLAEDPPAWMDELPEEIRPGEYTAKRNLDVINDDFRRQDSEVTVLLRPDGDGSVAAEEALLGIDRGAAAAAANQDVTDRLSNGEASIQSPLTVMRDVAGTNESFNETFQDADTDGDGIPDDGVGAVYDELFEVAPERAGEVLHRTDDGRYVAAQMTVAVEGSASTGEVTETARDWAGEMDADGYRTIASGSPVVNQVVQDDLFRTVLQSLIVSLVAVFLFLMVAYRITEGSATLGVVTLLPVAFSVMWILGTMYAIGMPFNVLTGMITSLTIGLGVAYSIHISERFNLELDRQGDRWDAMDTAVTGTGGALLGSAATTVGGFGTLAIAILPPLQQFGIITAMTIVYAFLASVLVLPSLLVVWTRFVGAVPADEPAAPDVDVADQTAVDEFSDAPASGSTTADGTVDENLADEAIVDRSAPDDATGERTPEQPGTEPSTPEQSDGAAVDEDASVDDGSGGEGPAVDADPETDDEDVASDADAGPPHVPPDRPAERSTGGDRTVTDRAADGRSDGSDPVSTDSESAGLEDEDTGAVETGSGRFEVLAAPDDAVDRSVAPSPPEGDRNDGDDLLGLPGSSGLGDRAGSPRRAVEPDHVTPGGDVTVTVRVPDCAGRVMLIEELPDVGGEIEAFDPFPAAYSRVDGSLFVLFEPDSRRDCLVQYRLSVDPDAVAGESLALSGVLEGPNETVDVRGPDRIQVVPQFVADALAAGTVSRVDLERAARRARDGSISSEQLRWFNRKWLSGSPADESGTGRSDDSNLADGAGPSNPEEPGEPGAPESPEEEDTARYGGVDPSESTGESPTDSIPEDEDD